MPLKPGNPYCGPTNRQRLTTEEVKYSRDRARRCQCPTNNKFKVWQNLAPFDGQRLLQGRGERELHVPCLAVPVEQLRQHGEYAPGRGVPVPPLLESPPPPLPSGLPQNMCLTVSLALGRLTPYNLSVLRALLGWLKMPRVMTLHPTAGWESRADSNWEVTRHHMHSSEMRSNIMERYEEEEDDID